jgi:hypothetical protein
LTSPADGLRDAAVGPVRGGPRSTPCVRAPSVVSGNAPRDQAAGAATEHALARIRRPAPTSDRIIQTQE